MHYDCTRNRFNPQNRFIGDIEDGKRYPFGCYTKEEADLLFASKSVEVAVMMIPEQLAAINAKLDLIYEKMGGSNSGSSDTGNSGNNQPTYTAVSVGSFTASPTTIEKGSSTPITLSWTTGGNPTSITVNGDAVTGTSTTVTATDTTTYTLTATDGQTTAQKTATVTAANAIYYGVSSGLSDVTSLTKVLSNTKTRQITVTAGQGQYIIYAYPARLGNVEFWVEMFEGGFEPAVEQTITNSSGYAETYKIFRSTNPNLGETTVDIKEG